MKKQKVEDVASPEKQVPKKKNKKSLLIVIIVIAASFCFLSSAAATAGVVYWKKQQDKKEESSTNLDQEEDAEDNDGENDENDQDDQNDGDDEGDQDDGSDNDDQDDETDDDFSYMPTLENIYSAMDGLETYSMTITSSEMAEFGDIYAEYEAPDKVRIEMTIGGIKYESISIGDEVYTKQGDGVWTEMDLGYTEISEDFMDMLSDEDYIFLPSGQKDGYWYYEVTYEGTTGGMYVMKSTNYVKKIEVTDEEAGDIIIEFDDFNSDEINIQKPM